MLCVPLPADCISERVDSANSSGSTRTWITRVRFLNASLVVANVTRWTIRINYTFGLTSSNSIWVGNQTRFTSANWVAAGSNSTNSSRSTRAWVTRVRSWNTFLLFTNVISGTIRVNHTFRFTSGNSVRVGNQTRFTSGKLGELAIFTTFMI